MASETFSSTEPSILLVRINENACGGGLGSVSLRSSSPKRKARHFIQKKLAPSSILREAKIAYYARNMFEAGRFFAT